MLAPVKCKSDKATKDVESVTELASCTSVAFQFVNDVTSAPKKPNTACEPNASSYCN